MKQVSNEEFESFIRDLIAKKTTKRDIARELGTSVKKINYMIDDLAQTNLPLYMELLDEVPYVPRDTDIDPEALAIEVIRYGRKDVAEDLGISVRTITRTVNRLESINPELYELYRMRRKKMNKTDRANFEIEVEKQAKKLGRDINPSRKTVKDRLEEISATLEEFERLVNSGMNYSEAAKAVGYRSKSAIWMMYKDRDKMRLALEMKAREKEDSAKKYRDGLKLRNGDTVRSTTENNGQTKEEADASKTKEGNIDGKGRDD